MYIRKKLYYVAQFMLHVFQWNIWEPWAKGEDWIYINPFNDDKGNYPIHAAVAAKTWVKSSWTDLMQIWALPE